eukprot:scaffold19464_cov63-Phaeocystis_antarctica.AAC.2
MARSQRRRRRSVHKRERFAPVRHRVAHTTIKVHESNSQEHRALALNLAWFYTQSGSYLARRPLVLATKVSVPGLDGHQTCYKVTHRPSWPTKAAKPGLFPETEDLFAKRSSLRGRTKVAKLGPPRARGQICQSPTDSLGLGPPGVALALNTVWFARPHRAVRAKP